MDSDLISRGTAMACAVSGTYRIINGERWIRVSDVRKNLEDIPAKEKEIVHCRDCKHYNAGFECLIEGYGIERNKDWFCGDAKRRQDDNNK